MTEPRALLSVVMYHYVRDLPRTRWPRIKGLLLDDFRDQVRHLREQYVMATLESAVEFLRGRYQPPRPLCLMTFDDGLKEHYGEVMPILHEAGIQGVFLIQTSALEGRVAAVHKNHFLLATAAFETYRDAFVERLSELSPETSTSVDEAEARRFYRWDSLDVAKFKYLLNFLAAEDVRERILDELFEEHLGDERAFARDLYVNWDQAREMQAAGMVIGGHSHAHAALTKLDAAGKRADLTACATLLRRNLRPQDLWPFSYPYGSFDDCTVALLRELGFICSFTTEIGHNGSEDDLFRIRRIDPKDVPSRLRGFEPCTF